MIDLIKMLELKTPGLYCVNHKQPILIVSILALSPFISGCSYFSGVFKYENTDQQAKAPYVPDPMMTSLDDSARRIALAYEKLARVPASHHSPSSQTAPPSRPVSTTPQATPALPVIDAGVGRGRPNDLVQPKGSSPRVTPLASGDITAKPLNLPSGPTTFVSTSMIPEPASQAVTPKSTKPQSTPALPPQEMQAEKTGGINTMVYLPGWTGVASRAVQIIAYKIGYKVHISGFRRGAEPTVVLGMDEQTAHDVLKDIGVQVSKSMRVRVDPQAQVIYLIYK